MHWVDYIIVLLSILAAIGTGVWFAHKQKDTSQYFAGGGKIPAWAVGISIFATLISSVTFLAYPGAAYADNWILLVQGLMVPIVLVALIGIIVPLFRKVIRLSTYEYFERRFGLFARLYSSLAFTLGHFSKAGTVFFLVSMALATFLNINIYTIVLVLGITIIILTLFGGMEAIVWMDVAQGFLLIGGGIELLEHVWHIVARRRYDAIAAQFQCVSRLCCPAAEVGKVVAPFSDLDTLRHTLRVALRVLQSYDIRMVGQSADNSHGDAHVRGC